MSKKSILQRDLKRRELNKKYLEKRKALKILIKKSRYDDNARKECILNVLKLDRLPKNSSCTRIRNRCMLTGRARGLVAYKYFGLCGIQLREKSNKGYIPGLRKI